jgi:PAS domain S-box-containing protein
MVAVETRISGESLQALRESERRFRAISACTYDWESWHDPHGRVQWINDAVVRMTGYSVAECMAMDNYPLPMVHEHDRSRIVDVLKLAAAGRPGNDVEFRLRMRDGRECWGAISWQSIADDEGINMGFRTSIRDIADRKRLEQQIRNYTDTLEQRVQERTSRLMELESRRANVDRLAALGQLAAGVAHEINNPLAGIRNAIELIHDNPGLSTDDRSLLDLVQSEIDRIGGIVRQLYQLHRPQPATEIDFDLWQLASQTIQLISGISRRHRVDIRLQETNRPISASLPEGELKQVLYNVLLNAVQASTPGSAVDVSITAIDRFAAIRITDYGTGIPSDVISRIFDPFFTTKHGTSHSGMGLGLSVSQSLVQAMGGHIEVKSTIGEMTTFVITVPRKVQERPEELAVARLAERAVNGDDRSA